MDENSLSLHPTKEAGKEAAMWGRARYESVGAMGTSTFTFGKHIGATFADVLRDDPSYALWALRKQSEGAVSGALADFAAYARHTR